MFINILDSPERASEIAQKARDLKQINGFDDGFKGMFRIQSVRTILQTNPGNGDKQLVFQIQGFAATELNNVIYYNPQLTVNNLVASPGIFFSKLGIAYGELIAKDQYNRNVQRTVEVLAGAFLGKSLSYKTDAAISNSPNKTFLLPTGAACLLGIKDGKTIADLYSWIFGIQSYSTGANSTITPEVGLNPNLESSGKNFWQTKGGKCTGFALLEAEHYNQVTVWSILQKYSNPQINEMFVAIKTNPEGRVVPVVTFRQKPFSSNNYEGKCTRFLSLPRWKIDPSLLYALNIGREEAARINYVQTYGQVSPQYQSSERTSVAIAEQTAKSPGIEDSEDISRNGLKPYVQMNSFDFPTLEGASMAPTWTRLLADMLMGGQLKLNGSITAQGIHEPIPVGDNLELNGIVYHIEGVTHSCSSAPTGERTFRTTLQLSSGVAADDTWPQMKNESLDDETTEESGYPGVSSDGSDSTDYKDKEGNSIRKPFESARSRLSSMIGKKKK